MKCLQGFIYKAPKPERFDFDELSKSEKDIVLSQISREDYLNICSIADNTKPFVDYLVNAYPAQVANKQNAKLKEAYNINWKNCPSRSINIFSFANEEKVVKPPQNPTIKKNFQSGLFNPPFNDIPKNNPMSSDPMILTDSVPIGKVELKK